MSRASSAAHAPTLFTTVRMRLRSRVRRRSLCTLHSARIAARHCVVRRLQVVFASSRSRNGDAARPPVGRSACLRRCLPPDARETLEPFPPLVVSRRRQDFVRSSHGEQSMCHTGNFAAIGMPRRASVPRDAFFKPVRLTGGRGGQPRTAMARAHGSACAIADPRPPHENERPALAWMEDPSRWSWRCGPVGSPHVTSLVTGETESDGSWPRVSTPFELGPRVAQRRTACVVVSARVVHLFHTSIL